jgi:hypothetical protein
MFVKVMLLSLAIYQLTSAAMNVNDQAGQSPRKPIPEGELKSFIGKDIEYQLSVDGLYQTGRFGGRVSKERFSIVYPKMNLPSGIVVDNDKIYKIPSCESGMKK